MNDILKNEVSRRRFLKQAGCAALGSTGVLSTMFNLQMANIAAAQSNIGDSEDDYKALVCVFLSGGNDSYNMLVPTEASEYANYQAVRGAVALPLSGTDSLLPLNAMNTGGRSFGLHPAMSGIQSLFDSGNVAFVSNVGTLVEPTTVETYKNKTAILPRSLFSHNDQTRQWQTMYPQSDSPTGWTGRIADILTDPSAPSNISMNISLAGNNIMQTGGLTSHYTISPKGTVALDGKNNGVNNDKFFRYSLVAGADDEDVTSLIGQSYQNLFEKTYLEQIKGSVEKDRFFSDTFASAADLVDLSPFDLNVINAEEGDDGFIQELKAIAQTIAARNMLGMKRQVFLVVAGGWDHHDELVDTQHVMLGNLSAGLTAFWDTLGNMGLQDNVMTFTCSDFGRTLRTNGRGTDHAWGGNHLIMGGSALCGQEIHGSYPTAGEMGLQSGLDVGNNGRMLPTTSVDQYVAEMALWLGVDYGNLSAVLPNIDNFYTPGNTDLPVGYLKNEEMPVTAFGSAIPITPTPAPTEIVPTATSVPPTVAPTTEPTTVPTVAPTATPDTSTPLTVGLRGTDANQGGKGVGILGAGLAATAGMIALRERVARKEVEESDAAVD